MFPIVPSSGVLERLETPSALLIKRFPFSVNTRSIPRVLARVLSIVLVLCKSINELCQQENKLLVGTPMLDNSKGTGKAILDHLFQRLKGYEANTTRLKKAKLLHKH